MKTFLLVSALTLGAAVAAKADSSSLIDVGPESTAASGAAVLGSSGDVAWNSINGGTTTGGDGAGADIDTSIHYADGSTATGVTYGIYNFNSQNGGVSDPGDPTNEFNYQLFHHYSVVHSYDKIGGGGTEALAYIEYTGLKADTLYDFVVYGNNNSGGRGFELTYDADYTGALPTNDVSKALVSANYGYPTYTSNLDASETTTNGVDTYDGNYLEFYNVETDDNGNLIFTVDNNPLTSNGEEDFVGTQLELAPEPGTSALIWLGVGVLAFVARRKLAAR